jgi:signal transduction histidine kinase
MTIGLARELADLNHGTHVCPIYETPEEQLSVVVPYLQQGLNTGERCLYIADEDSIAEVVEVLARAGVEVTRERQLGALHLLSKVQRLLPSGVFSPEEMVEFLRGAERQALADGFSGLRVAGEMTWVLELDPDCRRLIEYEASLNRHLENSQSVIICQYNRQRFSPAIIHDVLRTHPLVIFGQQSYANPYYEPPEIVLSPDPEASNEFKARRVSWWMTQLQQAKAVELEREQLRERLQHLSRRLLEVQESERRHLARELHDEIGQLLTGLRMLLDRLNDVAVSDIVKADCGEAVRIVDELLQRVRRLSFDLRPAVLDQLGLLPALVSLVESYRSQTGGQASFQHQGIEGRLTPEVETAAYRIVQEALTNVIRHAGTSDVTLRVWTTPTHLNVQVDDRGRGFDPSVAWAAPRSSGLAGMRERVEALGGQLMIESDLGRGTQIMAELPL